MDKSHYPGPGIPKELKSCRHNITFMSLEVPANSDHIRSGHVSENMDTYNMDIQNKNA
jgi:hypothetical protein